MMTFWLKGPAFRLVVDSDGLSFVSTYNSGGCWDPLDHSNPQGLFDTA
jgi:hypothetical protein